MFKYIVIPTVLLLIACTQDTNSQNASRQRHDVYDGKKIHTRFIPPKGFNRTNVDEASFAHYLQNLQLKKYGAQVHLYNGELKYNQNAHAAVLDIDVGNYDLQQCADAIIRIRAEYLFQQKRYSDIHFNFTNGFNAEYNKWRQGWRIKVNGNHCYWVKSAKVDTSYKKFRLYMKMVFSYAGTLSLSRELKSVAYEDMQIGDVLIQGGSPGHAVIIVDMIENREGEKKYLLAQSYMPAQDIHVLKNPNSDSPWYLLDTKQNIIETPEWTFSIDDLKRFK